MRAKNAFLVFFGLVFIHSVSLAWTNPSGNPPSGGGAIQVDGSGNIGVGTASPLQKFHVAGGDIQLNNNRFIRLRNAAGNGDGAFILTAGNDLEWRDPVSGSAVLTVLDGGNLGLGLTPEEKLDLAGELRFGSSLNKLGGLENEVGTRNSTFLYYNWHYNSGELKRDASLAAARLAIGANGFSLDYASASTPPASAVNLLTITPTGNVGIGSAINPTDRLVVVGGAGSVTFPSTGDTLNFTKNGTNHISATGATASLVLNTANIDRLFVSSAGDVGIGNTNPGARLEVTGQIKITGGSPGVGKVLTSDAAGLATWTASGGAGVGGSGSSGQAAFWSGASTLSGDNNFFWDNTNKKLTIRRPSAGDVFTIRNTTDTANSFVINDTGAITLGSWQASTVAIAFGGTGAVTAAAARVNLGAASSLVNTDITALQGLNQQNALQVSPFGVVAGNTGEERFLELAANGSNYVGFKAADNIAVDRIWTLPNGDGVSGQVLSTNGSGILSWLTLPSIPPAFIQGGNAFGGLATLGTNDNFSLVLETNGTERVRVENSGNVNLNANKIINLGAPTFDTHAATKKYVDDNINTGVSTLKVWGEGRPGVAVLNVAGECISSFSGVKVSRSNTAVSWDNLAAGCPAGWWACSMAERGVNACGTVNVNGVNCSGANTTPTDNGWVTDRSNETQSVLLNNKVSPISNPSDRCLYRAAWCCAN